MNHSRIGLGLAACFLGIIVPVLHHIALHAAVAERPTNNIVTRMTNLFEYLPWVDWLYLVIMFLVGLALIISGMMSRPDVGTE